MNYDATNIPASYDRGRARSPEVLALWMDAVASGLPDAPSTRTILDLGCGTGRFSGALGARFGALVIGVDPSKKMLAQARVKEDGGRVRYVLGEAEAVPLRDESVDVVFMSMVFHHFTDPARATQECRRVLRPGGRAFLRAGTAEQIPSYAPSRFFPEAVPIMQRVLAGADSIRGVFEKSGLYAVGEGVLVQEIAPTHSAYVDQLAAGADSVLAQLTPDQLENGLSALRAHARDIDPAPVTEPIDYFAFEKML
jgi:ubiquinone/menaquinone biosynthesis C-methylase UbiE